MPFLNREQAQVEEEQARTAEIAQAHAERDLYKAQCEALQALLKNYANQIVDLQVRNALLEMRSNG